MAGLALFAVGNALLSFLCVRIVGRMQHGDAAYRLAAGIVLFVSLAGGAIVCVSHFGPITSPRVTAVVAFGVALELVLSRRFPRPLPPAASRDGAQRIGALDLASLGLLGGLWLVWARRAIWEAPAFFWDDLSYHAAVPASWLQTGSLAPPAFTYQAYYPFNVELLSFWFMLPLGGDAQSNLPLILWITLAACACLSIVRSTGGPRALGALMACCLLASEAVGERAETFSAHDLATSALVAAALAFAARATWRQDERALSQNSQLAALSQNLQLAALSGLAAGFAMGARAPLIVVVAVLALWWACACAVQPRGWSSTSGRSPGGARWLPLGAFAACAIATGSFWYLQNIALTGNPLFPAELGPLAGPFDAASQRATSLIGVLESEGSAGTSLASLVARRLDWPWPLGLLCALGLVGAPVAAVLLQRAGRRSEARATMLVGGVAWLLLAMYPIQPFSGTINQPRAGLQHMLRYLLPVFVLGISLAPSALPRGGRGAVSGAVVASVALATTALLPDAAERPTALASFGVFFLGILFLGVGGALTTVWWWTGRAGDLRARQAVPAIGLAIALMLTTALFRTPAKQAQSDAALFRYAGFRGKFDGGWRALDALEPGSRVALVSRLPASHAFYYPLFGRRLHLVPVPIDHRGAALPRLHEAFETSPRPWWWEFDRRPGAPPAYVANLREASVDFLLISKQGFAQNLAGTIAWPAARERLRASAHAKRIYGDSWSELWAID